MGGRVLLCAALLAACTNEHRVTRQRCQQLRDHLIDLRLQQANPGGASDPSLDLAAHRKVFERALGERFVTSCQQKLDVAQLDCELAAKDSTTANACGSKR